MLLLCPQIPLLFMGEETASRTPFLFFTDHRPELADAVREGRRNEFARFPAFRDPAQRASASLTQMPTRTFQASVPHADSEHGAAREALYRRLLSHCGVRRSCPVWTARVGRCAPLVAKPVLAHWRMGDGAVLTLASNLGASAVSVRAAARPLAVRFRLTPMRDMLPGYCTASGSMPIRRPMNDEAVRDLARRAGIAVEWNDYAGRPQVVAPDALRRILDALGLP